MPATTEERNTMTGKCGFPGNSFLRKEGTPTWHLELKLDTTASFPSNWTKSIYYITQGLHQVKLHPEETLQREGEIRIGCQTWGGKSSGGKSKEWAIGAHEIPSCSGYRDRRSLMKIYICIFSNLFFEKRSEK